MRWARPKISETKDEMDRRSEREHEEIERRLSYLEAQVKVLTERAALQERWIKEEA